MAARSVSLAALLVGLLSPSVVLAANCGMVSTCPSASLPLSGTEMMYLIQNGHSVKTPVGSVTAAGTSPGGSNGQIQYNHAGAFGGFTVSGDGTINTSTGALTVTKSSGSSFGTAAFQNTGASGANLPFLNGNNTWSGTNAFGTPIGVGSGGTGVGSLTTNGLLYGGSTVGVTAAMTNGQVLVGQTSAAPAPETISGDCALTSGGAMTCTKSSGSSFGTAAFVNTGTSGATVPLNNGGFTQSGAVNFTSAFSINGTAETFPASGVIVGLTDSQALTNKTVNGLSFLTPLGALDIANVATNAQFAVGSGKAVVFENTINFAGTDSTTMTFPSTSATLARTDAGQTFAGTQVFGVIGSYLANVQTFSGTSCTLTATGNAGCSGYTGGNGDCGTFVSFTSASGITVTISSSLSAGCQVAIEQNNVGTVTLSAGSGATLHTAHSFVGTTAGQYSTIGITITANSGGSAAVAIMTGDGA